MAEIKKNKAFITSTGRTGTDFFTTLFNEKVRNAWSQHEPSPAFRARSYELIGRPHTIFEKYYFKLPRLWWHQKATEQWYVETNYHLFAAIPLIRDAFPEAKVAHIIRDGRKVVTSWLNKYRYITNSHITPFGIPDDPAQAYWHQWNPLQKLAWYWKTVNEVAEAQNPDLWLNFERIFGNNNDHLFQLLDACSGIEYDPREIENLAGQRVNETKKKFFPDYEEWPAHWKEQFREIAGKAMERYGYGTSDKEN